MKYLSIFIRVALLALGQSLDCHSASEAWWIWENQSMYNHKKAQQSKNRVHISWDILYTQHFSWLLPSTMLRKYSLYWTSFAENVSYCPACRTTLIATRFWVVMICPIIKCLTVLEFSFILFDLYFIHHNYQFYFKLCTYCNILDIYLS